jgi:hypothetical protein
VLNWLRLWGARVATVLPPPGCSKASNTYLHQNRETHMRGVNERVALVSHERSQLTTQQRSWTRYTGLLLRLLLGPVLIGSC